MEWVAVDLQEVDPSLTLSVVTDDDLVEPDNPPPVLRQELESFDFYYDDEEENRDQQSCPAIKCPVCLYKCQGTKHFEEHVAEYEKEVNFCQFPPPNPL